MRFPVASQEKEFSFISKPYVYSETRQEVIIPCPSFVQPRTMNSVNLQQFCNLSVPWSSYNLIQIPKSLLPWLKRLPLQEFYNTSNGIINMRATSIVTKSEKCSMCVFLSFLSLLSSFPFAL